MGYGDLKDFPRTSLDLHRCDSDKVIHNKAFNIVENPKYDGYQPGLASTAYKYFDKKFSGGALKRIMQIIRTFGKRKVFSSFQNFIWGGDLADMQL